MTQNVNTPLQKAKSWGNAGRGGAKDWKQDTGKRELARGLRESHGHMHSGGDRNKAILSPLCHLPCPPSLHRPQEDHLRAEGAPYRPHLHPGGEGSQMGLEWAGAEQWVRVETLRREDPS